MALQDMFLEIQQETLKEIEDYKNRISIEATKALMENGDSLENFYKEKKEKYIIYLQKKEEMLKAERDFNCRNTVLKENGIIYNQLLDQLYSELLNYIISNKMKYENILRSWINKVLTNMNDNRLIFVINPKDKEFFISLDLKIDIILKEDETIIVGFLVSNDKGVKIDLTFQTLFDDRKQSLLSLAIRSLKENL